MAPSADTLVISGNGKALDIEALKAIYGSGATVRVVNSASDLVGVVNSYSSIRRLVIGTHGSEGDVVIRGVHTSIRTLAHAIASARNHATVRDGVTFDGCNVAGQAESLAVFMDAVSAPKVDGFAASRLWWYDDYLIPAVVDDKTLGPLKKRYLFNAPYLVAGQPSFETVAKTRGRVRVWYEGFSRTSRERPTSESDTRMVQPRSALLVRRVSRGNAASLADETERLGGPMVQVEITKN